MKALPQASLLTLLLLALTFSVKAQVPPCTTPDTTDTILRTIISYPNSNVDSNKFAVLPLKPSRPGAHFSHLWWSGDNFFSFAPRPVHKHITPGSSGTQTQFYMTDVVTENYGTGGPPPLTYTFTEQSTGGDYRKILGADTTIFVQTYRNAVINDTMYLIITYANPLGGDSLIGAQLKLDVGPHAEIWWQTLTRNMHFLPNGETWDSQTKTIFIPEMPPLEERSILIPVKINENERDSLRMHVDFVHNHYSSPTPTQGEHYYTVHPTVAHSHDPNLMIEHSDVASHCDYRGGKIHYTVKFQNEGTGPTEYVRVVCHFDDKVDMRKISGIKVPSYFNGNCPPDSIRMSYDKPVGAIHSIDYSQRTLTIEMHHLILESVNDPNVPFLDMTRDQIEFDILVKDNYLFGPPVLSYAEIFFDREPPIVTNIAKTGCIAPIPIDKGGGFQCEDTSILCKYKWWFIGGFGLLLLILLLLLIRKRKKQRKEEPRKPRTAE